MEKRQFAQGTMVRCNRCDSKGHLDREVEGRRENDRAWRLQDMARVDECGHLDCHWVYDKDQE
jgi:hypothetical protein